MPHLKGENRHAIPTIRTVKKRRRLKMDYHIDDAYGYIGDLGRIPKLEWLFDFLGKKGRIFQELFYNGYTEDLVSLKKALKGLSSDDGELNGAIAEFREMVSRCRIILVINDGCNDYHQFDKQDRGGFESSDQQCGLDIFDDFNYQDIRNAHPPEKPGVFVIKVRMGGIDECDISNDLMGEIDKIKWKTMHYAFSHRLDQIVHMSNCPIFYIGYAGTNSKSRQTLAGKYRELAYCHPTQYYVWALLKYNWKLDFGWKVCDNPKKYAAELKTKFVKHHGQMPLMVEREEG
jgi:hypothetical protein